MKAMYFFTAAFLVTFWGTACNPNGQRAADDSIEQAQGVNDTTAMVNPADAEFAVKAADAGLAEVELGKLAQEKATDPRIKDFSQQMVDDHEKANGELKDIATRHNVTLPPVVSKDQADKQRKLRDKSGADFDKEYIRVMVDDHDKTVSLFEDASSDAQNADLRAFAVKTLPALKRHQEQARKLRDSIDPLDTTTVQRIMP